MPCLEHYAHFYAIERKLPHSFKLWRDCHADNMSIAGFVELVHQVQIHRLYRLRFLCTEPVWGNEWTLQMDAKDCRATFKANSGRNCAYSIEHLICAHRIKCWYKRSYSVFGQELRHVQNRTRAQILGAITAKTMDMCVYKARYHVVLACINHYVRRAKVLLLKAPLRKNVGNPVSIYQNGAIWHLRVSRNDRGVMNTDQCHLKYSLIEPY